MAVISSVTYALLGLYFTLPITSGHGMMIEPAMRSSLWRFDYPDAIPNYNDNGLNCGGFTNQHDKQHGRCGVCGDPYQGPRDNEYGGKYAKGIIARTYKAGQFITVVSDVTANHGGFIELRLCPHNNAPKPVSQRCLNENLLQIDGQGTRYTLASDNKRNFKIRHTVKLPDHVTCRQCVLQWFWKAGQHNGIDPVSMQECVGCGKQEEFINCADIAITDQFGQFPTPTPSFQATTPMPMYDQFLFQRGMYNDYFDEFSPLYSDPSFLNPFLQGEFANMNNPFGTNAMQQSFTNPNYGMHTPNLHINNGMPHQGAGANVGMQNPSVHSNNQGMFANTGMSHAGVNVNAERQNQGLQNVYMNGPVPGSRQEVGFHQNVNQPTMFTTPSPIYHPYNPSAHQPINTRRPAAAKKYRRPIIPRTRRPIVPRPSPNVNNGYPQNKPINRRVVPPKPTISVIYTTPRPNIQYRKQVMAHNPDSDIAEAFEDLMDEEEEFLRNVDFWNDFQKLMNMSSPETKQALYELADDVDNLNDFHRSVKLMMQMMGNGASQSVPKETTSDSDDSFDINWLLKEAKEQGLDSDELGLLEDAKRKRDSSEEDDDDRKESGDSSASTEQNPENTRYYGNNDENRVLDDSGNDSDDKSMSNDNSDEFDDSKSSSVERKYGPVSSDDLTNDNLNKDYDSDSDNYQHNEISADGKTSSSSMIWGYNQPTPTQLSERTNPWNENRLYRMNVDYDDKDVNIEGDHLNKFKKTVSSFDEKKPSFNYYQVQKNKLQVNTFGDDAHDYSESDNVNDDGGNGGDSGDEKKKWNTISEEKTEKEDNQHWSAGAVPDIHADTVIVTSRKRGFRIVSGGKENEKENENEEGDENEVTSKYSKSNYSYKKNIKLDKDLGGRSGEAAENEVVEKNTEKENEHSESGPKSKEKEKEDVKSNNVIYGNMGPGKSEDEKQETKTPEKENEINEQIGGHNLKSHEKEFEKRTEENSKKENEENAFVNNGKINLAKTDDAGDSMGNSVLINSIQPKHVDDAGESKKYHGGPFIDDASKYIRNNMENMRQSRRPFPTTFPAMNSFTTSGTPFMRDDSYATQYQQTTSQHKNTLPAFRKHVQNKITQMMGRNADDPLMTQPLTLKIKIKSSTKSKKELSPNLSKLVLKMFMNSKSGAPPCDGNTKSVCRPVKMWSKYQQVVDWCTSMCPYGQCPSAVCNCECPGNSESANQRTCRATDAYKQNSGDLDQWCQKTCSKGDCPPLLCICS